MVLENYTNAPSFIWMTEYFMNSIFPNGINEWNKPDTEIKTITS